MGLADLSSRSIIGRLFLALEEAQPPAWVSDIGMSISSDQESETYRWLAELPAMREWLGGRQANRLDVRSQVVRNQRLEASLVVSRAELRRDSTGQIQLRINELAARSQQHWAKLLTDTIVANSDTYDGVAFYGLNHDGVASNDNALAPAAASPAAPTTAEFESSIFGTLEAMLGFKDAGGEPMNDGLEALTVVVPTGLYGVAQRALNDQIITDGGGTRTNSVANLSGYQMRLAVNPRLAGSSTYYAYRSDSSIKPYILQEENAPQIEALAEGSDFAFQNDAHQYGISKSCAVGNGVWQYAVKNTFA